MAIVDGHIRCGACGETKPFTAFSPSIVSQGYGRCRDCARSAQRAARERDPERFKGYRKAFVARNPEAARAATKKWEAKQRGRGPTKESIRCSSCGEEKPVAMFTPSVAARGSGACRKCKGTAKRDYEKRNREKANAARTAHRLRNLERSRATARAHYRSNPEMYRNYNLGRYGITTAEYDAMLAAHGGCCACCGVAANRNGKRLFVDHDHVTGSVRGVICHQCNAGIGALGDNIAGVRRALSYLERAQGQALPHAAPSMRINLLHGVN
jgi:hypothetical protein